VATRTLAELEPLRASRPRVFRLARRVTARPLFLFGVALVSALVLVAVFGPLLVAYSPLEQDSINPPLAPPDAAHLMGTDFLGRDAFARLVYGAGVSLQVGVAAVALAAVPGIVLGLIAVYRGGWVDDVINRFFDALMAFPSLVGVGGCTRCTPPVTHSFGHDR
jgi:peptide/nickel transport system permease protein